MTCVMETAAGLIIIFYSSFFEWFMHRHFMHTRRFPLHDAFDKHVLLHHQLYKGKGFIAQTQGRPDHITLQRHTFCFLLFLHLPFFGLFQYLTGLPTVTGAIVGSVLYYGGYEYLHYLMHVPQGHAVERFGWFRFLQEHHRLHHEYMLRNFNVLLPLADLCLGTLITAKGKRSQSA